jgi:hypothetical protein
MLLFIPSIINEDWNRLHALLTVLAVLYTCIFTAVLIDLFFGIKRARQQNIVRTSYGYRRTIHKLTSYFGLMLLLTIADVAASIIFKIPYFTVVGTIGIILVEAKSVFEKLKNREKNVEEIQKTLLKLFENKEEIQSIIKFFNSQNQTDNDTNTRISQ